VALDLPGTALHWRDNNRSVQRVVALQVTVRRSIGLKKDECASVRVQPVAFAHSITATLLACLTHNEFECALNRLVNPSVLVTGLTVRHFVRRYFLQNKLVTKQDIANLLESAGFSR
jgi:hypothetical protein